MTIQIEYRQVSELIPYEKNSRIHSEVQLDQIAASIKEFGFRNPIIVDGNNILAGHGRVEAAKKLGIDLIPTIDASDLTETQKQAYIIADNKIALNAEWDESMLLMEIEKLKISDFDLSILAFDASELQVKEIDYSILDEHNLDRQLDDMTGNSKKAIQIEFEPDHYEEAQELFKFWRNEGAYIGSMVIQHLRSEKNKLIA